MKNVVTAAAIAAALCAVSATMHGQKKGFTCDPDNGGLKLPAGFCAGVIADGCRIWVVKLGANRSISAAQLANNDAGATSRFGFLSWLALACISSNASTWMVFPSPMSSARQAPNPRPERSLSHATPAF